MAKSVLAYCDSFSGLIPCKILSVEPTSGFSGSTWLTAIVKYTADRGSRKRGQIDQWHINNVVPRSAVYRSRQACGQYRIRAYDWRKIAPELFQGE